MYVPRPLGPYQCRDRARSRAACRRLGAAAVLAITAACTQTPCPERVDVMAILAENRLPDDGAKYDKDDVIVTKRMIEVLEPYEKTDDPWILTLLAMAYEKLEGKVSSEAAHYERALSLKKSAALCGHNFSIERLADTYRFGEHGVEENTDLAKCLDKAVGPEKYWAAQRVRWCLKRWGGE